MVDTGVQGVGSDPCPAQLYELLPPERQEIKTFKQLPPRISVL